MTTTALNRAKRGFSKPLSTWSERNPWINVDEIVMVHHQPIVKCSITIFTLHFSWDYVWRAGNWVEVYWYILVITLS